MGSNNLSYQVLEVKNTCFLSVCSNIAYILKDNFFWQCGTGQKSRDTVIIFFLKYRQLLLCHLRDECGMLNNLFSFYTGVPSGGIEVRQSSGYPQFVDSFLYNCLYSSAMQAQKKCLSCNTCRLSNWAISCRCITLGGQMKLFNQVAPFSVAPSLTVASH